MFKSPLVNCRVTVAIAAFSLSLVAPLAAHAQNFVTYDPTGSTSTTINGISNAGVVVGFATIGGTNTNFTYNAATNTFTNLNNTGFTENDQALAINSAGTVVGVVGGAAAYLTNGSSTATTITGGASTPAMALGINDNGVIVGQNSDGSGFVDNGGTITDLAPTLFNPSATAVNLQGINDNGIIAGFYTLSASGTDQQMGFLYNLNTSTVTQVSDPTNARIAATGGVPVLTQLLGINDAGIVSGYYQLNDGNNSQYSFLYNSNTQTYSFRDEPNASNDVPGQQTQFTGINNAGMYTGFYQDIAGATTTQHGFLASVAPEPGTLPLLAAGFVPLLGVVIRRRAKR
jgi:hypothetical protein